MYNGANKMIVYIYIFPNGKKYVGQTANTISQRARSGYYFYFLDDIDKSECTWERIFK